MLNDFFTAATDIVPGAGGLDKFIGNCVMALFGAPAAAPDDVALAVGAADGIQ